MKKIVCTMLCIMLLFGLSACGGDVSEVKTHNVESESYSEEDIKAAIDTISFDVDSSGGNGSLNPNSTYSDWKWILVRTDGGKWQHVDHGY